MSPARTLLLGFLASATAAEIWSRRTRATGSTACSSASSGAPTPVMSRGELVIRRPVEDVFDAVADETNPYDPRIVRAEKLTTGPIGLHTRFRSETRGLLGTVPMTVELTAYDRPRRLASTTYLRGMEIETALSFAPCDGGTRMTWTMRARPNAPLRLLSPLINRAGRRQARRVWTELERTMEHRDATRTRTAVDSAPIIG